MKLPGCLWRRNTFLDVRNKLVSACRTLQNHFFFEYRQSERSVFSVCYAWNTNRGPAFPCHSIGTPQTEVSWVLSGVYTSFVGQYSFNRERTPSIDVCRLDEKAP